MPHEQGGKWKLPEAIDWQQQKGMAGHLKTQGKNAGEAEQAGGRDLTTICEAAGRIKWVDICKDLKFM